MDQPSSFPERLKWARSIARLPDGEDVSQRHLAWLSYLSTAHVGLLENGLVKQPSTTTTSKLAATLGTSTDWLWSGSGDAPAVAEINAAIACAVAARTADPDEVADAVTLDTSPEYVDPRPSQVA